MCLQKVEKTSRDTTHRILSYLSKIFHYAGATGRIDRDLTFGLSGILKKYKRGHYAAIEVEELPELLLAIHSNKARLYTQTFLALRLLMLTAVRTKELIGAKWVEIDFDRKVWTVPTERMIMKKQHFVPLSRQAIEILQKLKEMHGHREFVFPSIPRPRQPMSNATILRALERSGYAKIMTGHGFRSLFMGISKQELGYRNEVPDRQLAHLPTNSIDRAYDRAQFIEQRITLMQDLADSYDRTLTHHLQQKENNDRADNQQSKATRDKHDKFSVSKQARNNERLPSNLPLAELLAMEG